MTTRTVLKSRSSADDVAAVLDAIAPEWRDQGAAQASDLRLDSIEETQFTRETGDPFAFVETSDVLVAVLAFRVEGSRKPQRRLAVAQTVIGGMGGGDGYALVSQAMLDAPAPAEAVPGIAWMLSTGQMGRDRSRTFEL